MPLLLILSTWPNYDSQRVQPTAKVVPFVVFRTGFCGHDREDAGNQDTNEKFRRHRSVNFAPRVARKRSTKFDFGDINAKWANYKSIRQAGQHFSSKLRIHHAKHTKETAPLWNLPVCSSLVLSRNVFFFCLHLCVATAAQMEHRGTDKMEVDVSFFFARGLFSMGVASSTVCFTWTHTQDDVKYASSSVSQDTSLSRNCRDAKHLVQHDF